MQPLEARTTARLRLAGLALFVALLGAGCDTGEQSTMADRAGAISALQPQRPLLERMIDAETKVRFQGERRVQSTWMVGHDRYELEYRERVSADGHGAFAVEPLDLIAPDVSTGQEDLFLMLSRSREGFAWHYRDFRIHHLQVFLRNYRVTDNGAPVQVLGRNCADLTVRRQVDHDIVYRLAVDLATGVVLRCREENRDGQLLGVSEYESLDLAPDLSQVAWHQPAVDELDLADPAHPAEVGVGAGPPQLVDDKFVLLSAKQLNALNAGVTESYAHYVYTDGLEVLFLLYGGAVPVQAQLGTRPDDVAQVMPSIGPWQVVVATIRGERLIGMGKVDQDELLDLIESAMF